MIKINNIYLYDEVDLEKQWVIDQNGLDDNYQDYADQFSDCLADAIDEGYFDAFDMTLIAKNPCLWIKQSQYDILKDKDIAEIKKQVTNLGYKFIINKNKLSQKI